MIEHNPQDWAEWVMYFLDQLEEESKKRIRGFDFNTVRRTFSERIAGSNEGEMIKRFLEWGNHDISFGAFIGWRLFLG